MKALFAISSLAVLVLALVGCYAHNTAPDGTTPGCYDGGPTVASQPAPCPT